MNRAKFVGLAVAGMLVIVALMAWAQGGTPQFHAAQVEIRTTPDQVFPYLVEVEKQKRWISGLVELRPQDQNGSDRQVQLLVIGAAWVEVIEREGQRVEIGKEIMRLEKNQLVQISMHSSSFDGVSHLDLSPTASGTKVTQNLTITYKGLQRFLIPFRRSDLQRQMESEMDRLKKAVEESAAPAPTGSR